jgi:hypothetical protein
MKYLRIDYHHADVRTETSDINQECQPIHHEIPLNILKCGYMLPLDSTGVAVQTRTRQKLAADN